MIIKNAMEEFYYHFENNLDSIPSNEIKDIVAKKKYNSGFYELCLQYSEIALNADKFITENGQLCGCFKNEDFDNATSATCQYIRENNIKDTHRFLSSIKTIHYYAKKDNENRQSSGFIPAHLILFSVQIIGNNGLVANTILYPLDLRVLISSLGVFDVLVITKSLILSNSSI